MRTCFIFCLLKLLLFFISTGRVYSEKRLCYTLSDNEVKNLGLKWAKAVASGVVEDVVHLYHDDSVFIPSMSNTIRYDDPTKIEYYKEFLKRAPEVELLEDWIDTSGCSAAQYAGIQIFTFTNPENNTKVRTKNRFSFTFTTRDGHNWGIEAHHSSQMPNEVGGGRRLTAAPPKVFNDEM